MHGQLLRMDVTLVTYHDLALIAWAAETNIVQEDRRGRRASGRGQSEEKPSSSVAVAVTI